MKPKLRHAASPEGRQATLRFPDGSAYGVTDLNGCPEGPLAEVVATLATSSEARRKMDDQRGVQILLEMT